MKMHLVDNNGDLVEAWKREFKSFPEVTIEFGDIMAKASCALVSPANGFGFMDGGIDLVYRNYFGLQIETTVQAAIRRRPEGMLPVGAALIVPTTNTRIPYLIVAPTMEMPQPVSADNTYRAFRAALRVAMKHEDKLGEIYCPGLATGVGMVDPSEAAAAMRKAWSDAKSVIQ